MRSGGWMAEVRRRRAPLVWAVALAVLGFGLVALVGQQPRRPLVHPQLPWHSATVDSQSRLVPWYRPGTRLGYDRVLRLGWDFIERRVPVDPRTRLKIYLAFAVFDGDSLEGRYWQHNPASLYASFVDSLLPWYAYSGDRRAIGVVREMLDYQLAHGTTPAAWEWPRVPFATSCAGRREYGRCFAGMPRRFYGGVEPDKVGLLGLGYARFYQLTGERRYLRAALRSARALARHVRAGDAAHTPWPFRVDGRSGRVLGGAEYGGMTVAPVWLFDELIRLRAGETRSFRRARDLAWSWLLRHPLNPRSPAWNHWSGYYEDVRHDPANLNQAAPTTTALYLLLHPRPASIDPRWQTHAHGLLRWTRSYLGRGPFRGAWAIDEQRAPGKKGCCSPAGLGSDTARWAAANALLAERTGDREARANALRSLAYATYFARGNGVVSCCGAGGPYRHWFSDGYGDYLRSFSWTLGALPELAPSGEDHLLRSSSVVQRVRYGPRRLAYRTFDRRAVEVIRLSYRPARVLAGGRELPLRRTLTEEGVALRALPGGDFLLRVRHNRENEIRVEGTQGRVSGASASTPSSER
jgi:hypothetical protein